MVGLAADGMAIHRSVAAFAGDLALGDRYHTHVTLSHRLPKHITCFLASYDPGDVFGVDGLFSFP